MEGKRILYVTTEMTPYFPENPMSSQALELPKTMCGNGADVRIFMPKFGVINERRHQLHEVIRLSGMNLIVNDIDQPLIIKVASVPKERLQVYFIDNEEYFKRKSVYTDKNGDFFSDNDERAIFFAKGVLETVKKLNWKPDVVHVMGWMSSMLPLYLKEYYADDPFFKDSKVVVSLFDKMLDGELSGNINEKLAFDGLTGKISEYLDKPDYLGMIKTAVHYADAVVKGEEVISNEVEKFILEDGLPILEYCTKENVEDAYKDFYRENLMSEKNLE